MWLLLATFCLLRNNSFHGANSKAPLTNQEFPLPNANNLYSHYVMTVNATGAEYIEPFTVAQANHIGEPAEAITEDGGLPHAQASRLIAIWNRSQLAHRQEFSYRLA